MKVTATHGRGAQGQLRAALLASMLQPLMLPQVPAHPRRTRQLTSHTSARAAEGCSGVLTDADECARSIWLIDQPWHVPDGIRKRLAQPTARDIPFEGRSCAIVSPGERLQSRERGQQRRPVGPLSRNTTAPHAMWLAERRASRDARPRGCMIARAGQQRRQNTHI